MGYVSWVPPLPWPLFAPKKKKSLSLLDFFSRFAYITAFNLDGKFLMFWKHPLKLPMRSTTYRVKSSVWSTSSASKGGLGSQSYTCCPQESSICFPHFAVVILNPVDPSFHTNPPLRMNKKFTITENYRKTHMWPGWLAEQFNGPLTCA